LRFPRLLFIASDALGSEASVTISDHRGQLSLPRDALTQTDEGEMPLEPPSTLSEYFNDEGRSEDWGYQYGPDGPAFIKAAYLIIPDLTESNPAEFITIGNQINESYPAWFDVLCDQLEVLTKQDLRAEGTASTLFYSLHLAARTTDAPEWFRADPKIPHGWIRFPNEATAASVESWNAALSAASRGDKPPLEYLLLRDARHALWRGALRTCVIDAATAVELTITGILEHNRPPKPGPDDQVRIPESLGPKLQLCQWLGIRLPYSTLRGDIVKPRNLAVHTGASIDSGQAKRALKLATQIVEQHMPI
jgi:hypothetical protein